MHTLPTLPKMVLFDYGGTLATETRFDGIKGYTAVLNYAKHPYDVTPERLYQLNLDLNAEIHRFPVNLERPMQTETSQVALNRYIFDYFGLEFTIPDVELATVFWDNTSIPTVAPNVAELLEYLYSKGIRTGVVSNMGYPTEMLASRVGRLLPNHHFEFIVSTADYVFRKPSKRIFEVALKKAKLSPQEVIYCGDSFDYDVLGALHSDITPVWYHKKSTPPTNREQTFITVEDWKELIGMLTF